MVFTGESRAEMFVDSFPGSITLLSPCVGDFSGPERCWEVNRPCWSI